MTKTGLIMCQTCHSKFTSYKFRRNPGDLTFGNWSSNENITIVCKKENLIFATDMATSFQTHFIHVWTVLVRLAEGA